MIWQRKFFFHDLVPRYIIKIDKIKELLQDVLRDFDELNENNFSRNFTEITQKFKLASKLQNELNLYYSVSKSSKNEDIAYFAKQISVKYDNTVEEWKQKAQAAQKELELVQNHKKLTSYRK